MRRRIAVTLGLIALFCASMIVGKILFDRTIGNTIEARAKAYAQEMNLSMVPMQNDTKPIEGTTNILILGVDERDGDSGRSDTIIIASINFITRKIGLISIPRDTLADIPLHGKQKINHAYAFGGVKLTKQVVENTTGLKINNYVIADFKAFKKIVDAFGGVEIDVEKDMYYRDDYDGPHGFTIDLKKGKQKLDGGKALQYVRYRDDEGDIGRANRQQKFLKEMAKKLISANVIMDAPNIIRQLSSAIRSDISFNNMVHFLRSVDPTKKYDFETILLSGHPEMIDDLSYWVIDKDLNHAQLVALSNFVDAGGLPSLSMKPQQEEKKDEKKEEKKEDAPRLVAETSLDWQIAKLDKENKERRDAREKLLQEEREEREANRRAREVMEAPKRRPSANGITIINTTSDESKAEEAVRALTEEELEIGMVSAKGSGAPTDKTIFIIDNNDKETIAALKNLPFKFTTLYRKNTERPTLIIGADF